MTRFCLIGNAPSSGSTLLADILDSSDHSACGPELEIFCNKTLYDFPRFQKHPERRGTISTLKSTGVFTNYDRLNHYGFTRDSFNTLMRSTNDLEQFIQGFRKRFIAYRGKSEDAVVYEKTPQNISCINAYFEAVPAGKFIYIVRNPLYVYNSLRNRGWSDYLAISTWLIAMAHAAPHWNSERLVTVRYEDLTRDPFHTGVKALRDTGIPDISPEQLEEGYYRNQYRSQSSSGLSSWEASADRHQIINGNRKKIAPEVQRSFSRALGLKISRAFAQHYGLPELTYREALHMAGYDELTEDSPANAPEVRSYPRRNLADYQKLTTKWFRECIAGEASPRSAFALFRAVENI